MNPRQRYKKYLEGRYKELLPKSTRFDLRKRNELSSSSNSDSQSSDEAEISVSDLCETSQALSLENNIIGDNTFGTCYESASNRTEDSSEALSEQILSTNSDYDMPNICSDSIANEIKDLPEKSMENTKVDHCDNENSEIDGFVENQGSVIEDISECIHNQTVDLHNNDTYASSTQNEPDLNDDGGTESFVDNDDWLTISEESDENIDDSNYLNWKKFIEMISKDLDSSFNMQGPNNKAETLLACLKFALKYSLSQTALAHLFELINTVMGTDSLPESRYRIDKLFSLDDLIKYHAVCPECNQYIRPFNRKERYVMCEICETNVSLKSPSYVNFFVTFNISLQIKSLLENNDKYYNFVVRERTTTPGFIEDFYDGQEYRKFLSSLPLNARNSYTTLTLNADGAAVFKSSKFSVWPIQVMVNELPMDVRYSNVITSALYFGKTKPDMRVFLDPFVHNLNELSINGILCKIENEIREVKAYALCCCVDSDARPSMQGLIRFNGYFGCTWCEHPGVYVDCVKFPLLDYFPSRRTELSSIMHIREAVATKRTVFGFKYASPIMNLNKFNLINGFVPDSMHQISEGVAKQFLELWIGTSNKPFSLTKENENTINDMILSFKAPNQITRLTRTLSDRKYWKAREYENWILYYSLPILTSFPNFKKYCRHWELLVEAFYILLKKCISHTELQHAHMLLKKFVGETELYYSKTAMTYNVHQLLHLTQSVADWGPLWAHSCYAFESGNHKILKSIKAAKGVVYQICRNITLSTTASILKDHLKSTRSSEMLQYCDKLDCKETQKCEKIIEGRYYGLSYMIDKIWIERLNLRFGYTVSYKKIVKNKCLYLSSSKSRTRSENCYARTTDGTFIRIDEFVVDKYDKKEYTLCKYISVRNKFNICNSIKEIVEIEEEPIAIKTSTIDTICIHMTMKRKKYICAIPNTYHY